MKGGIVYKTSCKIGKKKGKEKKENQSSGCLRRDRSRDKQEGLQGTFRDSGDVFCVDGGLDDTGAHTCQNSVNIHYGFVCFVAYEFYSEEKL